MWLQPDKHRFQLGSYDDLELWLGEERLGGGLFVVRAFPATYPLKYLSIRGWNEEGDEVELGMINDLEDWGSDSAAPLLQTLERRYLLREIRCIHDIQLHAGYLDFDVDTDAGREKFAVRWTQSQAIDFGDDGKMLIDTEENRYLVRDVARLPKAQGEKFMQYVYW
ncbi:MAG: DUF1854 domain-containing protein [Aureliella sp.]